jgi:hypothetical protein
LVERESKKTKRNNYSARAKFQRAKRMATSGDDKSRLNEILGIKAPSGYKTVEASSTTFMASFSV